MDIHCKFSRFFVHFIYTGFDLFCDRMSSSFRWCLPCFRFEDKILLFDSTCSRSCVPMVKVDGDTWLGWCMSEVNIDSV